MEVHVAQSLRAGAVVGRVAVQGDSRYGTEEERARAFVAADYGCRATYFNHAKKLPALIEAPKLVLVAKKAEPALAPVEDLEDGAVELPRQAADGTLSLVMNHAPASQELGHEPSPQEVGDAAQVLSLAP